jgi:AcrR family transcriptional regulator
VTRPAVVSDDTGRSDRRRNRDRLLDAAGDLIRSDPESVTIVAVAEAAALSTATAYRHFPSVHDLGEAYLLRVVLALGSFTHQSQATGGADFESAAAEWGRLVTTRGAAMLHLRSRRGLLERLADNDRIITALRDAWQQPITALMNDLGIDPGHFPVALLLCNALLDPREILDLTQNGLTTDQALQVLTGAFIGALQTLVNGPRLLA